MLQVPNLVKSDLVFNERLTEFSVDIYTNLGSMSAYLRNLIIYGYVYDVDYKFLHDYSVELARIGNLINQIAKRANTTGNLYSEDMKEVKELMEKIWHTHESMLSKQPSISR